MPARTPEEAAGLLYLIKLGECGLGVIEGPALTAAEVRIVEAFLERLRADEPEAEIQKLKP